MNLANIITPFKVGLLVIAAAAATIFMMVQFTSGATFGDDESYTVYAYFNDATGLAVRSRVSMAGIPVGRIKAIKLEGQRARIDIAVADDLELYRGIEQPDGTYLNGATVTKKQASLLGDYFLELSTGTRGDLLEDGDQIHNAGGGVGPEELFDHFNKIAQDIEEVTSSLAGVFGSEEGQQRMDQMVADLGEVLHTMRQFVEDNHSRLNHIVANAEMTSEEVREFAEVGTELLEGMISDARSVVQEVKFIVGQSSGDLQAGLGTLQGTLARLQSTLDSLNYSLQNIQDITDKVNEGEGTVGKLINDPSIAQRTDNILAEAEEFVGRIGKLKTVVELRSAYYYQHQKLKNIVGLRLQPSADKYYLIQLVDDFRGKSRIMREDISTTRTDSQDPVYRETTVTTTNEFKFSAQLAKGFELHPSMMLFGRFGIIESSGGLGLDAYFTEDHSLQVQTDLFDFGTDVNPRFRAQAAYEFFEYAYIMGGIDDIFNDDRRDYFFGIGLSFDDEDLKALISTTGVPAPN